MELHRNYGDWLMMRTIEVLIAIIIITGAFIAVSTYVVLPKPGVVSPMNLDRLSLTTLQLLDNEYNLSAAAFDPTNNVLWSNLQTSLSASLPADVIYNLTVYDVNSTGESGLYNTVYSISNAESVGTASGVSSYMVASSNVTFNVTPQKIGESSGGGTLYILNCSDANGWWISGYTSYSLAQNLYQMLSPYFVNTVMVQNTSQLESILHGVSLQGETVQNAVIINTCGEAVPIPADYCNSTYSTNSYAYYSYYLGQRVNIYNWTWCSIVGYPFYYVSNTVALSSTQSWGIYGTEMTGQGGINAFLEGLDNQTYVSNTNGLVGTCSSTLTTVALTACNYYGIYPSATQTFTRALSNSILQSYDLSIGLNISYPVGSYDPGTLYNHIPKGGTAVSGNFLALGLDRTPDVRITAISLLSYYSPRLYNSEYTAAGTSREVVLQLGLVGED